MTFASKYFYFNFDFVNRHTYPPGACTVSLEKSARYIFSENDEKIRKFRKFRIFDVVFVWRCSNQSSIFDFNSIVVVVQKILNIDIVLACPGMVRTGDC